MEELINKTIKQAIESNQRRIIVIAGNENYDTCSKILDEIKKTVNYNFTFLTHSSKHFDKLKVKNKLLYQDIRKIMGTTQDALVVDLNYALTPNDVGLSVETVKGGGIIIFLTPDLTEWQSKETRLHKYLNIEGGEKNFVKRFVRILKNSDAVSIIENNKVTKESIKTGKEKRKKIILPEKTEFERKFYGACVTNDQVKILKELEDLSENVILTADRGRGKTALLGIFASALKNKKVIITSPEPENVQVFFEFLRKFDEKAKIGRNKGNIIEFKGSKINAEYLIPKYALNKKCDLLIVDEAAGIQINTLLEFCKKNCKKIFSSTIHGYEGAGRSFNVLFMQAVKNAKMLKMSEPIRYSSDDLVEKWIYSSLLLNAEPNEIKSDDLKEVEFKELNRNELFEKGEDKLREFVGVYVIAHYQNKPNDLFFLADAPHLRLFCVEASKKIVSALQVVEEKGEEQEVGNIIPDRIIKHYCMDEFSSLDGFRIQRIAVVPGFQSLGFGTKTINEFEKFAKDKDWIGTVYGVNYRLLKFWCSNGFFPVHISPNKNAVSGEYSVIQIKPIKENDLFLKLNYYFRKKFIEALPDTYKDLDSKTARLLLKTGFGFEKKIKFSDLDKKRLERYFSGMLSYESVIDLIKKTVKNYFLNNKNILPNFEEEILISKALQNKSWEYIEKEFNISFKKIFEIIRESIRQLRSQ